MRLLLSIVITLLLLNFTNAQTTAIPDPNFEQALINLGLDTGIPDGVVLTANIDTLSHLDVSSNNISNLIGIEDFTYLVSLDCAFNQITSLNLSQNVLLTSLRCFINQLTSLDVSQNTLLFELACGTNQLTNIDISQNTSLAYFSCGGNQLTSLDLSQNINLIDLSFNNNQLTNIDLTLNTALTALYFSDNQITNLDLTQNINLTWISGDRNLLASLNLIQNINLTTLLLSDNQLTNIDLSQNTNLMSFGCNNNLLSNLNLSQNNSLVSFACRNNLLTCLNVKNGNNLNSLSYTFSTTNNPNLTCIEVDDIIFSTTNWTDIDPQTSFSTNCINSCIVGIDENDSNFSNLSVYPVPTSGNLHLDLGEIKDNVTATLRNSLGQVVSNYDLSNVSQIDIDIKAPTGIYFLQLISSNKAVKTIKIVKE